MSAYELFTGERGWRAERVLVISPFVERTFFDELLRRLKPRHLHVVIDDSCRQRDLDLIKGAVEHAAEGGKWPRLHLRQAAAPGLVHAKLFCITEKSVAGRLRRKLVYGSGNATQQAFSGTINAEAIATCRLIGSRHREAIEWFEKVQSATQGSERVKIPPVNHLRLGEQITIQLPSFSVAGCGPKSGSFDLWLQRGRLLSVYRPEPGFLTVPVVLKKPLPLDALTQRTEEAGFPAPQRRRLTYPYFAEARAALEAEGADDETTYDAAGGHWRRRYFTWTQLGDWCSELCFKELQAMFVRRGHEKREAAVSALLTLREKSHWKTIQESFIAAIERLWSLYGDDAPTYLAGNKYGPDKRYYCAELDKKVIRDLAWAQDEEFSNRYIRGYELVEVPRFRADETGWGDFALSFCRQLLLDGLKSRRNAWLARTLYDACLEIEIDVEEFGTAEDLLDALKRRWRERIDTNRSETFGQRLALYHSQWC
jgi:hypothetical protein